MTWGGLGDFKGSAGHRQDRHEVLTNMRNREAYTN
jgi:hypothetical protein